MDGQLRAYVWAQAIAAALSTNHPADQAAQTADKAVAEFDKRTFSDRENEQVEYLKGQLAEREAELTGAQSQLEAAQGVISSQSTKIEELGATVEAQALELAQRAEEVIAPAPAEPSTLPTSTDEL